MKKNKLTLACLVVLALSALLVLRYLFRTETVDNPALGYMHYKYRWGSPDFLLGDTNRDGRIDARASYRGLDDFGQPPITYWEDRNFNGIFESKSLAERGVDVIWVDDDEDGVYDRKLYGEEARQYYLSLPSPSSNSEEPATSKPEDPLAPLPE